MRDQEVRELYTDAIRVWGEHLQIFVLAEECNELSAQICRAIRGRMDKNALAEEIADVGIMLEQVALWVGEDVVQHHRIKKLHRLRARLEAENVKPVAKDQGE